MRVGAWTVSWGHWRSSVGSKDTTGNVIKEPVDTRQQVLPGDGTAALDAPVVAADGGQVQGLGTEGTGGTSRP